PLITIEIASPGQSQRQLHEDCEWYVANGVRLALLLYPHDETVGVYAPGASPRRLRGADCLEFADTLPGFTLVVQDLYNAARLDCLPPKEGGAARRQDVSGAVSAESVVRRSAQRGAGPGAAVALAARRARGVLPRRGRAARGAGGCLRAPPVPAVAESADRRHDRVRLPRPGVQRGRPVRARAPAGPHPAPPVREGLPAVLT